MSSLPYKHGKIVSVPNLKKSINYFEINYDRSIITPSVSHLGSLTKIFPDVDEVKKLLKEAILRADVAKYRFDGNKNRKPITSTKPSANEINNQTSPGSSLLSGILSEMSPQIPINSAKDDLVNENNVEEEPESDSDEDSGCDINDCAIVDDEEEANTYDDKEDNHVMYLCNM